MTCRISRPEARPFGWRPAARRHKRVARPKSSCGGRKGCRRKGNASCCSDTGADFCASKNEDNATERRILDGWSTSILSKSRLICPEYIACSSRIRSAWRGTFTSYHFRVRRERSNREAVYWIQTCVSVPTRCSKGIRSATALGTPSCSLDTHTHYIVPALPNIRCPRVTLCAVFHTLFFTFTA